MCYFTVHGSYKDVPAVTFFSLQVRYVYFLAC